MTTIRRERADDEAAIHAVTKAAFTGHPKSDGSEPAIVDRLRSDGDLTMSLVAEDAGTIVGHIAFSPAILSDDSKGWLVLGPICVLPDRQGNGIGRMLIEEGARKARKVGAKGIILVGAVELYSRFGFLQDTAITGDEAFAPYLQVLPFVENIPAAKISFVPAFGLNG